MNWEQLLSLKRQGDTLKRLRLEQDETRIGFEVDYDRIIFSSSFRSLQDKTQVIPFSKTSFVHTRLTHSLEVSVVGRSLGRIVGKKLIEKHPHLNKTYGFQSNDFGAIVNQVSQKSGAPSLISRALNDHAKYQTFVGTYYRGAMATNNDSDGWKYIRHSYAKVPNTGAWLNAQSENWGKFIDKNMNNGKVNQELWAASIRVHPQGNGYNWNVLTVDAFKSLKDLFANGGEDYPDMSSVNFDDISSTMPNDWHKQVIWERVLWTDSNGNLMKN